MFVCALFFFSDQRLRFQGSCGWAGSKKGARPMDKGAGVKERERERCPCLGLQLPSFLTKRNGRPGRLPGNETKLQQLWQAWD